MYWLYYVVFIMYYFASICGEYWDRHDSLPYIVRLYSNL